MAAPAPPTKKVGVDALVDTLNWKMNTLDSKVRINEQNIMNERRHVQLVNKNVLDFKREVREQIEVLLQENKEVRDTVNELRTLLSQYDTRFSKFAKKDDITEIKKMQSSVNLYKSGMTKDQASTILDSIVDKGIKKKGTQK